MTSAVSPDIEALRAALAVAEARADEAEARAMRAVAEASNAEAIIAALKLMIEKLRRELYGQRSERKARLLDQLELKLEELEANASEDELAAEQAAAKTSTVTSFTRNRPSRKPFPEHLPRERVVVPAPAVCGCCGSDRLCKLGEDVT
jgi:chromosome segregation ATPase